MPDSVQTVLDLVRRLNLFVFPCAAGTKEPPSGLSWPQESTQDETQIRAWAKKYSGCNWALHHGKSGTVALDVDVKNGKKGRESFDLLEIEYGNLPKTFSFKSPSGGFQKIYRADCTLEGNRADLSKDHPDVEILRNNSYSLIPPSVVNKKKYVLEIGGSIASLPEFIAALVGKQVSETRAGRTTLSGIDVAADTAGAIACAMDFLETAPPAVEGQGGDNATFRVAAHLRSLGVGEDTAMALMLRIYNPRCVPHWSPYELAAKVANAYRYAKGSQGEYAAEAVFKDSPKGGEIQPPAADSPRTFHPNSTEELIAWMNKRHAFGVIGASAYVTFEGGRGQKAEIRKIEAFNHEYANTTWKISEDKKAKAFTWSKLWLSHPARRNFKRLDFAPTPSVIDPGCINLWQGFATEPAKAADESKFSLYREHVEQHVCGGDPLIIKYVWDWCADLIQNPGGGKPGVAIVLKGGKGSGKGTFAQPLLRICAPHSAQLTQRSHLIGNFNGHLSDLVLAFADEASWPGEKAAEGVLKGLITEEQIMVERKGVDAYTVRSFMRLIMASNENWVCPASHDERRYLVLNVDHERAQDHEFFGALNAQMDAGGREALFRWLMDRDTSGTNLRQAPVTDALLEQKDESLCPVGKFWLSILEEGDLSDGFDDEGATWPEFILKDALYAKFEKHFSKGYHGGNRRFFRTLKSFFPDGKIVETRGKHTENKRAIVLPALDISRELFSKHQRQERKWEK